MLCVFGLTRVLTVSELTWLTHLLRTTDFQLKRTMTIKLQRQKSGVVCVICSTRNIRMPQWLRSGAIPKEQSTMQVSTWTSILTTTETATADFSATVNSAIRLFSILTARVISKRLQTSIFLTTKRQRATATSAL